MSLGKTCFDFCGQNIEIDGACRQKWEVNFSNPNVFYAVQSTVGKNILSIGDLPSTPFFLPFFQLVFNLLQFRFSL